MTIGRRRGAAAALLAVAVLGLSACSDEPEPEFAPPSPSPSASDSPVAEPTKEPWEKKTDAGAVAFLDHWVDTLNEAGRTGVTEELEAISDPACESCSNLIRYINETYESGGRIAGIGWDVLEVSEIPAAADPEQPSIAARVRQNAQTVYRPGKKPAKVEPTTVTISFLLAWKDHWVASRAEVQS